MAYPQAPIECDMYMELPQGIQVSEGDSSDYVLKLLKAGRVWNTYLFDKLTSLGYKALLIDDCVFDCGDIIFMVYVDDGIFLGKDDEQLKADICEIQESGLNIEDQGHPSDYVGVNIKKLKDGSYEFTQRALLMLSLLMLDLKTLHQSLFLPRLPFCSMHSRMLQHLTSTSIIVLSLGN